MDNQQYYLLKGTGKIRMTTTMTSMMMMMMSRMRMRRKRRMEMMQMTIVREGASSYGTDDEGGHSGLAGGG